MARDRIWAHHRGAALTTFFATPVAGLAQVFIAEPLAAGGDSLWLIYQWTVWLMIFSVLVSWLILIAILPLAVYIDRRHKAAFWLALPLGAMIGWVIGQFFNGDGWIGPMLIGAALTGAVMAAIYCTSLRWLRQDRP